MIKQGYPFLQERAMNSCKYGGCIDYELKLTLSVLPYPLLFVFLNPLSAVLLDEWVYCKCFL